MEFIENFRNAIDWTEHLSKSQSLRTKYPDKIPVIVDRANATTPKMNRNKFLVPADLTVGQFLYVIRKHMPALEAHEALFIFVKTFKYGKDEKCTINDTLPTPSSLMSSVYREYQDRSGYVFFSISTESTFGCGG
jgi:GABA(A) receptor-associated protein